MKPPAIPNPVALNVAPSTPPWISAKSGWSVAKLILTPGCADDHSAQSLYQDAKVFLLDLIGDVVVLNSSVRYAVVEDLCKPTRY
jgi:hypothetical protein